MVSPQDFIDQNFNDDGNVRWPSDERQREELAQTLFGLMFIESLDGWVKVVEDWLNNPQPSRPYERDWNDLAKMDRAYRAVFQTLNEEQRSMVSRLLRHAISGSLFGALASIDQFPHGRFEIAFVGENESTPVPLAPGWQYLHDRFNEWRQRFSTYPRDDDSAAAR